MTESFEDAIKALRHIARGNGNVMRIADRIVAAHERELAAAKLAAEMPTYDVDGNERHKAACELRDMKIGKLSTHWDFVCSLAARLNIPRPNDEPYEDYELHELIRDKLVNLLEGECNFSTPESYMACEDGDPNPAETSPDEQTSVTLGTHLPITGELRAAMHQWGWVESDGSITFATSPMPPSIDAEKSLAISGSDFDRYCDAIDSIHAQLERENADLRVKFVNANRHARHVERENEALKTERKEPHRSKKYGSITGELRKWADTFSDFVWVNPKESEIVCTTTDAPPSIDHIRVSDLITAIVDRIDADYESTCWEYEDEFDGWKYVHDTEFVELPKDADGVPIRVGDVMVYADGNTCPLPVVALVPPAVFLTDDGPRYADLCRHAPDTWERIIEDALDGYHDTDFEKLVSRCKKLAGDAE